MLSLCLAHNALSMLGFNWVDLIIVVALLLVTLQGVRVGFTAQALAFAGFFGALFLAGWIFPHLLPVEDSALRTRFNATLVLLTAVSVSLVCLSAGRNVHWSFKVGKLSDKRKLKKIEAALGGAFALVGTLIAVWLLSVAIGRLPFEGLSNSVSDAKIVQSLTRHMPAVPAVFAQLDRQIDPNSPPYVSVPTQPHTNFDYSAETVNAAIQKAAPSVVRITSFGCGGLISGSGFVVEPNLVATNAHVIAGVKRPIIKYNDRSYEGVPVYFNSSLDIAFLRTEDLPAPALAFAADDTAADNTSVAVLGYPRGNYRAAPGIIRSTQAVSAPNIYSYGSYIRDTYAVQTDIDQGSSGGPVVLANGRVAGMIFSESLDRPDYGYALTAPEVAAAERQAINSKHRVNTGACTID